MKKITPGKMRKQIEDMIYFALNNYDINPLSRAMANEISKDIVQKFNEYPYFEGIYREGKYYRKLKDGSYYSADGMVYLKDELPPHKE